MTTDAEPVLYDAKSLAYFATHFGDVEWSVHVQGHFDTVLIEEDEDTTNVRADWGKPLTRERAVQVAADYNDNEAIQIEAASMGLVVHAVVLHHGVPQQDGEAADA